MKHKVLILSTSAGTGHVRCGSALEKAFSLKPDVAAVRHCDALDFTNKLFRDFYSKLYAQLVEKAPDFLGWWYKQTDEPWKTDKMRLMLDRLNTRPLVNFIKQFEPDICLCTHFMPAGIISHLIGNGTLHTNLSIVITDYDLHAMWLARNFHRYFVARDEVHAHLEALGIPLDRISTTGIPIDPVFSKPHDKIIIRTLKNLPPGKRIILLNLSGLKDEDIASMIAALCRINFPLHTIVLCGKSVEMKLGVEKQIAQHQKQDAFTLLGYTNEINLWMAASDLYIGKPGGLTTSEALASGLPIVIISPIPGQEERNSDFLLENGAAIKCPDTLTIHFRLAKLLKTEGKLEAMSRQAMLLGCPYAAQEVTDILLHDKSRPEHNQVTLRGEHATSKGASHT